jgi:hypothetical protein
VIREYSTSIYSESWYPVERAYMTMKRVKKKRAGIMKDEQMNSVQQNAGVQSKRKDESSQRGYPVGL